MNWEDERKALIGLAKQGDQDALKKKSELITADLKEKRERLYPNHQKKEEEKKEKCIEFSDKLIKKIKGSSYTILLQFYDVLAQSPAADILYLQQIVHSSNYIKHLQNMFLLSQAVSLEKQGLIRFFSRNSYFTFRTSSKGGQKRYGLIDFVMLFENKEISSANECFHLLIQQGVLVWGSKSATLNKEGLGLEPTDSLEDFKRKIKSTIELSGIEEHESEAMLDEGVNNSV